MKIFILIILSITIGCREDPRRHTKSDPEFKEYIKNFEDECDCSLKDIPINFATDLGKRVGKNVVGACWSWSSGYREIEIDREYWYYMLDNEDEEYSYSGEQLIFHEAVHCKLNRSEHLDGHFEDKCPKSVMRSWAFSLWEINYCYLKNYDYYMDELFGGGTTYKITSLYSSLHTTNIDDNDYDEAVEDDNEYIEDNALDFERHYQ